MLDQVVQVVYVFSVMCVLFDWFFVSFYCSGVYYFYILVIDWVKIGYFFDFNVLEGEDDEVS